MAMLGLFLQTCRLDLDDLNDTPLSILAQSEPSQGEELLEARIKLNVGTLEIAPGQGPHAYELDLQYDGRAFDPQLDFSRDGKRARLAFELRGKSVRRVGKTRVDFRLNPETPLRLESQTGVGESHIDLSGMKVESVLLECGVGKAQLSMLSPNRVACDEVEVRSGIGGTEATGLGNFGFRRFRFKGGVGGSTLDFSGSWEQVGEVEIQVGVGSVEILIPRDVGAEIRVTKSFLSGLDISGFRKDGDTYVSENIDRMSKIVRFRITAGIGGVEVRWI